MGIMSIFSGALSAISSVFNWMTGRSAVNNTPAMQDRATAQKEADDSAAAAKEVKDGDDAQIQKDLS